MRNEFLSAADIEQLAHRRAVARLGWYVHAIVYLAVNAALYAGAMLSGRQLSAVPAFAWGLGLGIHAVLVWLAIPGSRLYERLLQRELARLQPQRDPW